MKNYFVTLFNYDCYANELILKTIIDTSSPEKPMQLMAHLLAAQQVWLNRCLGLPTTTIQLWPALGAKHEDFAIQLNSCHHAWIKYLNGLNNDDFEEALGYKNTRGDSFEDQLQYIFAHFINHGTHHRAQIGQLLKLAGLENLPNTDFIGYLRQLKN
jgi:uncharacterized damage-inducible protein DinB